MKKLYWLFLIAFLYGNGAALAQWQETNIITFDTGDTLWPHVIVIDTVNYQHNQWQVGRPQKNVFDSAHSVPYALVTDTVNAYAPNDTSVFVLSFPDHFVSSHHYHIAYVSFSYKLEIDTTSYAMVELSADTGKSWVSLPDSLPHGARCDTLVYNDSNKWHNWRLDAWNLGYYNTDTLLLRFTFVSGNDTMSKDGWVIDDINVFYYWEGAVNEVDKENAVVIYPNPASDQLTIQSEEVIASLSVSNIVGQVMYEQTYETKNVQVNTSGFPPGMYFLKVNNSIVEKFVKQ